MQAALAGWRAGRWPDDVMMRWTASQKCAGEAEQLRADNEELRQRVQLWVDSFMTAPHAECCRRASSERKHTSAFVTRAFRCPR